MAVVVLGLGLMLCAFSGGSASPLKRTYDQRQQGELNIHAQLDNILIVLIPTSKISLTEISGSQQNEDNLVTSTGQLMKPEKNAFLQFLQKHIKNDIDRFGVVKEDEEVSPHDENEVVSQEVALKIGKDKEKENVEKEEEVVATVEEMKPPEVAEKTTEPPKLEATEETPIKEHSTVSETVQETIIKVSVPEELKDAVKKAEEETKKAEKDRKKPEKDVGGKELTPTVPLKQEPVKKTQEVKTNQEPSLVEKGSSSRNKPESSSSKETSSKKQSSGSPLDELIKPLAAKEALPLMGDSRKPLVEGTRKEKVIRYKPESKWAPGLEDLLGPVRPRGLEVEERQRFSPLCSPGVWDAELKTCIMPGETRSRKELARFLEAMRFGIALPTK